MERLGINKRAAARGPTVKAPSLGECLEWLIATWRAFPPVLWIMFQSRRGLCNVLKSSCPEAFTDRHTGERHRND